MAYDARRLGARKVWFREVLEVEAFRRPVQRFIRAEESSGIVVLAAALAALVWANSPWAATYRRLWEAPVSLSAGPLNLSTDLRHLVNDGLMAVFFFVVVLEVKREFLYGHLAGFRRAIVPVTAALGGMAIPALIFLLFTAGTPLARGWGIPMATDVAFALGVMALLGRRVEAGARVFLLSIAVADDVGSILVIAIGYAHTISWAALGAAALVLLGTVLLFRSGVYLATLHAALAVLLWTALFRSGVHATVAGVALGVVVPARPVFSMEDYVERVTPLVRRFREAFRRHDYEEASEVLGQLEVLTIGTDAPLDRMLRRFHPWSSFVVLPIFALANAGIEISLARLGSILAQPVALGAGLGLLLGKPLGIVAFTMLALRLGPGERPEGVRPRDVVGVGMVAGIGFTVSIFIAGIAYDDPVLIDQAKLGVLLGSVLSGLGAYAYFRLVGGDRAERGRSDPDPPGDAQAAMAE